MKRLNNYLVDFWASILESELKSYDKLVKYKESILNKLHELNIEELSNSDVYQINLLEREINILKGVRMTIVSLEEECIKFSAHISDQLLGLSCRNDFLEKEHQRLLETIQFLSFWKEQEDQLFKVYVKHLKIEISDGS